MPNMKWLTLRYFAVPIALIVLGSFSWQSAAFAQSPSAKLQSLVDSVPQAEFEAAEVKPCKSGDPLPECRTLHDLLGMSWAIEKDMISGEPGWAKSDYFEIVAKMPPGIGKPSDSLEAAERYAQMLRTLLVERFKIAYHFEDKLIPVYALEVAKQKSKLKESEGPADDYQSCRNLTQPPGIRTYECHHVPMQMLASWLQHQASDYIDRPVVDFTSLKGAYDISLRWSIRRLADGIAGGALAAGADPSEALTIFQALNQQLGLTLSPRRFPEASVVIDHIEKLQ
jgi:uncharacterized protein (TIGR03435 family)